jgi:hypothetical protein
MKKILYIFILLLLSCTSSKDIIVQNQISKDFVFQDVSNKIYLHHVKKKITSVVDQFSNEYKVDDSCSCFILVPDSIKTYNFNAFEKSKFINTFTINSIEFPEPELYIKGFSNRKKTADIDSIKNASFIDIKTFLSIEGFDIISFEMIYHASDGGIKVINSNGKNFTEEMLNYLSNLQIGQKLEIGNVKVKYPNGKHKLVMGFNFRVI